MRFGNVIATTLGLLIAAGASAQTEGRPGGAPSQGGQRPDPARFVEQLMQGDTDGDGKLSRSELPPQLAERIFDRADTNKDGFLDKAELDALAKAGGLGGGRGGEGGRGGGAGQSFEGGMKASGRAMRSLKGSAFDSSSRTGDLDAVQALQSGLVAAKGQIAQSRMSEKAKAKFGDDRAKYESEMRRAILRSVVMATELEVAILDGSADRAKALVGSLGEGRDASHDLFQVEEEEGGESAAPAGGGRGGEGGRRGRGGQGGGPGGQGSEGGQGR